MSAGTRNTNSVLTEADGQNRTNTHLSTNIIIKVDNYIVGALQSLSINETRTIKMIDEIGTDGHIDSAPISSANIGGNASRVRFQKQRITEAFGRGFIHVAAQRLPFDIEIHDFFHTNDRQTGNTIVTTIKNVWIKSLSYDYHSDNWIITDKMDFEAETIYSKMLNSGNGNVVQATANGQGGPILINQYEQEADRGDYRGALDAAGILTAFSSDPHSFA